MKINNYNVEKGLSYIIYFLKQLLIMIVLFFFASLLLFGCAASLTLLYKTYPDLGRELIENMFTVSKIFSVIFTVFLISLAVSSFLYYVLKTVNTFEKSKKKRNIEREKFLDDLADKLTKRGIKNVQKQPKK